MPLLLQFNNNSVCVNAVNNIPSTPTVFEPTKFDFLWFVYVTSYTFTTVCVLVFLRFKHKYDRLRLRPISLVLVTCLAAAAQLNVGVLDILIGPAYPCVFGLLDQIFIVPLAGASPMARTLVFLFLSRYSTMVTFNQNNHDSSQTSVPRSEANSASKKLTMVIAAQIVFKQLLRPPVGETYSDIERKRLLWTLKFMVSYKGLSVILAFLTAPYLAIFFAFAATDPVFFNGCTGCQKGTFVLSIINIAIALITVMGNFYPIWLSSPYPDKWGLRQESKWILYSYSIALLGYILLVLDPRYSDTFDWNFLFSFGMQMAVASSTIVQVYIAQRDEKDITKRRPAGRRVDSKQSTVQRPAGVISLDQIMATPVLSASFEAFLRNEFAVESYHFLRDVAKWKRQYFDVAGNANVARARKLVHQYISTTGLYAINIDSKTQAQILRTLPESSETAQITLFDSAVDEIRNLLIAGAVQRFSNSKAFQETIGSDAEMLVESKTGQALSLVADEADV